MAVSDLRRLPFDERCPPLPLSTLDPLRPVPGSRTSYGKTSGQDSLSNTIYLLRVLVNESLLGRPTDLPDKFGSCLFPGYVGYEGGVGSGWGRGPGVRSPLIPVSVPGSEFRHLPHPTLLAGGSPPGP